MSAIVPNQLKTTTGAFVHFVLVFCLLVPTIGTIVCFVLLDRFSNEYLAIGCAACVYLSSVILGLFTTRHFRAHHQRGAFWALVIATVLNGVSALVAIGALILSFAAAGLNIH